MAGIFTDEQLKVILGMGDLGERERDLEQQLKEAELLRTSGSGLGSRRMDWASQANRALQGTLGGMRRREQQEQSKVLGEERRKFLKDLYGIKEEEPNMTGWGYL